jgi:hypothetical protein
MDLNFGCNIYVYKDGTGEKDPMQQIMELFQSISTDISDPAWQSYKSFFISMTAKMELDFSDDAKRLNIPVLENMLGEYASFLPLGELSPHKNLPIIFGRLLKFHPTVHELKVFDGSRELKDEADQLNAKISDIKQL